MVATRGVKPRCAAPHRRRVPERPLPHPRAARARGAAPARDRKLISRLTDRPLRQRRARPNRTARAGGGVARGSLPRVWTGAGRPRSGAVAEARCDECGAPPLASEGASSARARDVRRPRAPRRARRRGARVGTKPLSSGGSVVRHTGHSSFCSIHRWRQCSWKMWSQAPSMYGPPARAPRGRRAGVAGAAASMVADDASSPPSASSAGSASSRGRRRARARARARPRPRRSRPTRAAAAAAGDIVPRRQQPRGS